MQQTPPSSPEKKTAERSKGSYIIAAIVTLVLCIGMFVLTAISNNADNAAFEASRPPAPPTNTPTDPDPNAPVTCNSQTMYPNEICDHILTINGANIKNSYTYEEQKEYQAKTRIDKILNARQEQMRAHNAQKPTTTFLGCLSSLLCLAGLFFAFCCFSVTFTFFKQYRKKQELKI
jgi:hypothetical protein